MCDQNEQPLEIELQSLEAIYVNELTFTRKDDGSVDKIEVLIHPATGHDATKQFVCMTLIFEPGPDYPDEVPDIEIRNPRGLGDEEVASLVEALFAKGEEVKGEVMMYTLIEMAKDSLTDGNVPRCACVVCLEHFQQQDSFHRTACYHYFHTACLYKYVQHTRAQLEEEKKEALDLERRHVDTANSETRMIVCPLCRQELDEVLLSVTWTDGGTKDEAEFQFVMPPEMREQQLKMAEIYERQKAKGGIIDPEQEKNKFLVNYEDRFFVYAAASNQTAETQSVREQRADDDCRKKKGRNKPGGRQQHSHQKGSALKHGSHTTLEAKGFNKLSARSNAHGARPQTNRRTEKHLHRSEKVSGSGPVKQDEERVEVDRIDSSVGVSDSHRESSGGPAQNPESVHGSITASALESIGRLNIECPGEAVSVQPGLPSEISGTSNVEPGARVNEIKFKKWDSEYGFSNRHDERPHEKFGLLGSPKGGSDYWRQGKSGHNDGNKQSSHGARGNSGKANGRYYDHHHPQYASQHPHREHWRQHERHRESGERSQQGPGDSVGQSKGGDHASSGENSLDPESQDDAERKNFCCDGKWRLSNFKPDGADTNHNCESVCAKFFSNSNNLFKLGLLENKENICINKAVGLDYDINEYYVGFGSMEAEDEWENEIDPFAFERSCIRKKKLESYDKMKKADVMVYENRLEDRVSTEVMVMEEERRMEKERAKQEDDLEECKTYGINETYLMDKQMKVCGKECNFVRSYTMHRTQDSDIASHDLERKLDVAGRESDSDSASIREGLNMETNRDVEVNSANTGELCQVGLSKDKLNKPQALLELDITQPEPLAALPVMDERPSLPPMSAFNARLSDVQAAGMDFKKKNVKKAPPLVLPKRAKQGQASAVGSSISAQSEASDVNSAWRQTHNNDISSISGQSKVTDVNSAWRQSQNNVNSVSAQSQVTDVNSAWRQSQNNVNSVSAQSQVTDVNSAWRQSQNVNSVSAQSQVTDVNSAWRQSQNVSSISAQSQVNDVNSAWRQSHNNINSVSAQSQVTDVNSAWRQSQNVSSISAQSQVTDVNSAWRQSQNVSSISAQSQVTDVNSAWRQSQNNVSSISAQSKVTDVNSAWRQSQNNVSSISAQSHVTDVNSAWRQSQNNVNSVSAQSQARVNQVYAGNQPSCVNSVGKPNGMPSAVPPAKHKFVKAAPLNLTKKSRDPVVNEAPIDIQAIIREMNMKPQNPGPNAMPGNRGPDSNYKPLISSLPPRDSPNRHLCDLFSQVKLPQPGAGFTAPATLGLNNEAFVDAYYKALGLIPDLFISGRKPLTEDLTLGQNTKRNK